MRRFRHHDDQVPDRPPAARPVAARAPEQDPTIAGVIDLQRAAGNTAVRSLVTSEPSQAVQRSPGPLASDPTVPDTAGPGRGSEIASGIPEKWDPEKTPGGGTFAAAQVLVDGIRAKLDRVALEEERAAALTALMAREPSIYDTLHANPGKGLQVNLNFKSTDPDTLAKDRPAEYKPTLQLKFLSVTVSEPYELPEPSEGPAITPAAAGTGDVGYGWIGHTLTATIRPVRPDPSKPRDFEIIDSVEGLAAYVAQYNVPTPLVAGQLKSGRRTAIEGGAGAGGQAVVEVNVFGTQLLVLESVANAVADAFMSVGREDLKKQLAGRRGAIERLQAKLSRAAGEGGVSQWWNDRSFSIDPHLLDSARAHLAAAEGYAKTDDLANASTSLSACDDQLDLVAHQLNAYETNDFSDPFGQDPLGLSGAL